MTYVRPIVMHVYMSSVKSRARSGIGGTADGFFYIGELDMEWEEKMPLKKPKIAVAVWSRRHTAALLFFLLSSSLGRL